MLEAMAASLPIVASDISGNRDIVVDGENGLLVTPGNINGLAQAVGKILASTELRNHMRMHAKKTALKFDWLDIAKQYESLYKELI